MKPIIRMSSSGKCIRALSAKLQGIEEAPAPEWLARAAQEGNYHEAIIKDNLRDEYAIVGDEQLEIKIEQDNFTLVGHIDGKIMSTDDTPDILLEIKSMSQLEFDRWMRGGFEEFPNYAAQLACYMEGTGLESCLYIVKNRNNGYVQKRLLNSPPTKIADILSDLSIAVYHASNGELAEREYRPETLECKRCRYKDLCIPEPKEMEEATREVLNKASEDWRKGTAMVEDGQALVEKSREIFMGHSKATEQAKWRYNDLSISLSHIKKESYPKSELLKIFSKEQLDAALKITEYDMIRITDQSKEE